MWFVPMSYFYSETNDWSQDWAKLWALLWLATLQQLLANSIENFISHEKKIDLLHLSLPEIYKALKPCGLLNWVSIARVVACYPQASQSLPAATASDSETPCVLARPTRASRAREQPQELGRWFCPLKFRFLSGTAFREIARWSVGAQTSTQNWTLPPDQQVVNVL